jgi:hypothetical protein
MPSDITKKYMMINRDCFVRLTIVPLGDIRDDGERVLLVKITSGGMSEVNIA